MFFAEKYRIVDCVFSTGFSKLFYPFKEKSWSVRLVPGYILDDQIRSHQCENCKSISQVLAIHHQNPNLLLYGCRDSKCKHRM